ncbi:hypothetical protein VB773_16715 [Haloarculaceae archaeon H-GB2-1]|nr:hypothetical protein [Haloarculaceae archaeon H-GB1-1]MEA5387566.1 hypothetical protein [Haloarculaceae archaeon H-GB11]MEA5409049.1 hypothetical protein [Haloarculaceae archaeon H-GB2-1]
MSDRVEQSRVAEDDELRTTPALPDAVTTTGAYEDGGDTVFYDADEPLAWVQSDTVCLLSEMA